ncbi:MAG TPA: glycine--tRNA ligase subunit beta, partial [Gammaproteobacteria bacterium]|nr:glycine--tRNA ligase subunit beta [Gammaproteobacteria bacterium]
FATPRRLAVLVHDLVDAQPDQIVERKGPPVAAAFDKSGASTKAAQGFARFCGVDMQSLETVETDKGAWLYCRFRRPGKATRLLLPSIVSAALAKLPIPRRMRWGAGDAEFVRPVHWVVLLFGGEIVDAEILGIRTGRQTRGHRFLHPEPIPITTPAEYPALLEIKGKVLADFCLRRARIQQQVDHLATGLGGRALMDEALLNEVTALVEWPHALSGNFDARFLSIPPEVLTTTMQGNQRYFPVVSSEGQLLPYFITVSNIESLEPEKVRAGNERVIRPRFIDAAFFWQQDRKAPLSGRLEALKAIAFQKGLGSLLDKTERVERLAGFIAKRIDANVAHAGRAAILSKCDLATDMVFEFPNLQGVMGRYYVAHDGEPEPVAIALEEQYWPRHAGDQLPRTKVGQTLALADRLDTLVGIFAIGHRPTGEKDPFGLRRAALGILRILIECELDLDLEVLLRQAANGFAKIPSAAQAVPDAFDYIMDRLRAYYADRGIAPDVFNAVIACRPTRPLDFERRVRAVQAFRQLPEAESLTTANKRISNILKHANAGVPRQLDEQLLRDSAEQALFWQLEAVSLEIELLFQAGKYDQALARLAGLRQAVDRFFDEVLVMDGDATLRENRIALLSRLSSLFLRAADLSCLQQS